jgi:hypothetical protein
MKEMRNRSQMSTARRSKNMKNIFRDWKNRLKRWPKNIKNSNKKWNAAIGNSQGNLTMRSKKFVKFLHLKAPSRKTSKK